MNKAFLLLSYLLIVTVFSAKSQFVYKTPSGKKYHLASCRMVENVSQRLTIDQAQHLNLDPCKICKPGNQTLITSQADTKKVNGQSITTQCKGMTKARSRCKHMTRIGNGYCYQHQPG